MKTSHAQFLKELLVFTGVLGGTLILSSVAPDLALANPFIDANDSLDSVSSVTGGEGDFKSMVKNILEFFLGFLGFGMVLMVIYAGILYITAAGNEDNVGKAKQILMYCAIGTVLIFMSYAFVNTLLSVGGGALNTNSGLAQ